MLVILLHSSKAHSSIRSKPSGKTTSVIVEGNA